MSRMNLVNTPSSEVARIIAERLNQLSRKRKILLLLAGGSAVEMECKTASLLNYAKNIVISLTDERYLPAGHPESNWQKLKEAGFDFGKFGEAYEVVKSGSAEQSAADFAGFLNSQVSEDIYLVGIFGMGADGHTSGVLPGSSSVDATDYATTYKADDFTRITTTPAFIAKMDEAYIFAYGENKHQQIEKLIRDNLSINEQPVQVMKQIEKVTLFNDYKGDL